MKLRYKILGAIAVVLALGVLSLALAMSHTAPCGPSPPLPAGATPMKAIVHRCYGSPDVIRLEDIPKPSPKDDEILVRVHAASVNPLDWHYLEGTPYMVRMDGGFGKPEDPRLGVDFSGTVEAVGKGVTRFKPGDEVFGGKFGALAEYVAVREERAVALKPANISHEQAAAVAIAAITALQGLRDKGHLRAGQNVLVNGASGGVGTFAVQIAKSFGANVTGVCSTKNVELVRSIGADHVIDYTRADFADGRQRYDLILDIGGDSRLRRLRRALAPRGTLVIAGGEGGRWTGVGRQLRALMLSPLVRQRLTTYISGHRQADLEALRRMTEAGQVTPVIDQTWPLARAPGAIRHLQAGQARGKIAITI